MPLVQCPDCGQSISDAATHCIHCGRPAGEATTVEAAAPEARPAPANRSLGKHCPKCGRQYDTSRSACLKCGEPLILGARHRATPPPPLRQWATLRNGGGLALALGLAALFIALSMDTTVPLGEPWDGERIHNVGLINEKRNLIIVASVVSVIGAILLLGDRFAKRDA